MAEAAPGPSGPSAVMVEVGGSVGAAVVTVPAALAGAEIEIRRSDEAWSGRHVGVRARHDSQGGVRYAAVFGSLPAGAYELRAREHPYPGQSRCAATVVRLEVAGGQVTRSEWPDRQPPAFGSESSAKVNPAERRQEPAAPAAEQ